MSGVLEALVPLRCAACAAPAPQGLCGPCGAAAEELRLPAGGWTLLGPGIGAVGVYAYDGVIRDAVVAMKLQGRHGAARPLSAPVLAVTGPARGWPVTWVPSSRRRLRERGVEIPRLLAGAGAVALLRRVAERPDQTTLSAQERRRSPVGAFAAAGTAPPQVVVVDDVRTTGATALAAATALRDAGASRVLVATLAVGGDDARGPVG